MKKVLLTIPGGSLARNLLKNNFYKLLCTSYDVIILTPADQCERFRSEFAGRNVKFVHFEEVAYESVLERFVVGFHKMLIYNPSVDLRMKYGVVGTKYDGSVNKYVYSLKRFFSIILSKIKFLRKIVRQFDSLFLQKKQVESFVKLLNFEKPDLVFSSHVMGVSEIALIKAADKMNIKTLVMPKSWDNPSKGGFRVKGDRIIVWSPFMAKQVMEYQDYNESEIVQVGIPQHDYFFDKSRIWSRDKFCSEIGLDPAKRVVLFGSEGKQIPTDVEMSKILADIVNDPGRFGGEQLQLLIRPHTGYLNEVEKFNHVSKLPNVRVDSYCEHDLCFKDVWDYSDYFMDRFLNSLYHADIVINTASSLTLDSLVFNKPIINIYFDGEKILPFDKSVVRWYTTDYSKKILDFNATVLAANEDELVAALNKYLLEPDYLGTERVKLRNEFNYLQDGESGRRIFEAVNSVLTN